MSEEVQTPKPVEQEDTFSLDDLDQILEEADPGFTDSMNELQNEKLEGAEALDGFDVGGDEEPSPDEKLGEDEAAEKEETRLKRLLQKAKIPIQWVQTRYRRRVRRLRNAIAVWKSNFMEFIRHGLPERIKWLKSQARAIVQSLILGLKKFWAKPLIERLSYLGMSICALGALVFLLQVFKGSWLPRWEDPIIAQYEEVGENLGYFAKDGDQILLFEAFPDVEYSVRLEKVVVNLRRDAKSGSLPMGLFEFFLGVDAKDTAVELKDREKEVIDIVQRTLEGYSYNEIMSYQGKIRMKARVKENINQILNQGEVRRVYINRMITNH